MATLYPFRIEVTYKNGDTLGFFTESLARDTEPVISASIMNAKINCMPRATIIGLSGSAISGGYLSAEPDNDLVKIQVFLVHLMIHLLVVYFFMIPNLLLLVG